MTCWNSERFTVPSLSMSDSSRIYETCKGNNCSAHWQISVPVTTGCFNNVVCLPIYSKRRSLSELTLLISCLISSDVSLVSSVSPVRQFTSFSRSPQSRVPSSSKSENINMLNTQIESLTCTIKKTANVFYQIFTKYTECIVGFDFQSSRVTEGTQEVQKVLKCEAPVFVFRCWEYIADSFPERVGLWQDRGYKGQCSYSELEALPPEHTKHKTALVVQWERALRSAQNTTFALFYCRICFHLELRQSKNPLHRYSGIWEVFLIFREQFSESLVGTKTNKSNNQHAVLDWLKCFFHW